MAKIFYLKDYLARLAGESCVKIDCLKRKESARVRNLAKQFIHQASSLLNDLEEDDRRVGWLLSDCANLLVPENDGPVKPALVKSVKVSSRKSSER